jgi:Sec-independent protein translocase protein TatA
MIPFDVLSPWPLAAIAVVVAAIVVFRKLLYGYLSSGSVLAIAAIVVLTFGIGVLQRSARSVAAARAEYRATTRVLEYPELAERACQRRGSTVADVRAMHDGMLGDSSRYFVRCLNDRTTFVPPFVEETIR